MKNTVITIGKQENSQKIANNQLLVNQLQHSWGSLEQLDETEYETLRPNLAMTYPFELDSFQKQAVLRLGMIINSSCD